MSLGEHGRKWYFFWVLSINCNAYSNLILHRRISSFISEVFVLDVLGVRASVRTLS